jgi:hypothetical protein
MKGDSSGPKWKLRSEFGGLIDGVGAVETLYIPGTYDRVVRGK